MGNFRRRRNAVALTQEYCELDIHQLINLMRRKEFFDAVPDLKPLWSKAVFTACRIRNRIVQRADYTDFIWGQYKELHRVFLDRVRMMQEQGREQHLTALKPVVKRALGITVKWLLFHCPTYDGGVVHVLV